MKTFREYITEGARKQNKSKRLEKRAHSKKQRRDYDPMDDVVKQHGGRAPDTETGAERRKRYS